MNVKPREFFTHVMHVHYASDSQLRELLKIDHPDIAELRKVSDKADC